MASLRKKPAPDVVVAAPDATDPLAVVVDKNPPTPSPTPIPVAPQDEASAALRKQLEALRQTENLQQAQAAMQAAQERRATWVKSNPLAQQHYAALNQLHSEALQAGCADASPQYFDFLNNCLATLQAQQPTTAATHLVEEMKARVAQDRPQEPPPKPAHAGVNAAHMSAPVSREIPSGGSGQRSPGKITLTRDQLDAARISGVSPAEYARQLVRLQEMQASGEYSDRR